MKMIAGIEGAAIVVGGPLAGVLVDKVPHRWLYAMACLVFALMGAAPAVLHSLPLILCSRVVMGVAAVTVSIVGAALIGEVFVEPVRSRWMGLVTASAMAFALAAGVSAGLLGDLGWRWGFMVYLAGLPIGVLGLSAIRPRKFSAATSRGPVGTQAPFWRVVRWRLVALAFACGLVIYVPSVYIPFRLHDLGLAKPSSIGLALTLSVVSSACAASLFGAARRHLTSRAAFCCSFAAMGTGLAVVTLAPSLPVALTGTFISGAGIGWITPNLITSAFASVEESHRGRMLGLIRAGECLAPTVGVSVAEAAAGTVGMRGVLLANVALAALLLVVMAFRGAAAIFISWQREQKNGTAPLARPRRARQ